MIMQLTDFPGNFPADQEVSEIPLNFWYMLQETLFDDGIVPIRHEQQVAIVTDVDDDVAVVDRSETNPQQIAWIRQCGETALAVYRELVNVIKRKAAFPEDSIWRSWPKGKIYIYIYIIPKEGILVYNRLTDNLIIWSFLFPNNKICKC